MPAALSKKNDNMPAAVSSTKGKDGMPVALSKKKNNNMIATTFSMEEKDDMFAAVSSNKKQNAMLVASSKKKKKDVMTALTCRSPPPKMKMKDGNVFFLWKLGRVPCRPLLVRCQMHRSRAIGQNCTCIFHYARWLRQIPHKWTPGAKPIAIAIMSICCVQSAETICERLRGSTGFNAEPVASWAEKKKVRCREGSNAGFVFFSKPASLLNLRFACICRPNVP